jgi:hypothetical protein
VYYVRYVVKYSLKYAASLFPAFAHKIILLVFEQHVECSHAAVATRDVLLEVHLILVIEFFMGVDALFEYPQSVAHHHDFVEKSIDGYFFGLNPIGLKHHFPVFPALAKRYGFEAKARPSPSKCARAIAPLR